MLYENCFTWVTFLRDTILAVGIYMACVYDKEDEVIGGQWRVCGYAAALLGLITTILEFLKVVNYRSFDSASSFSYILFFICYNNSGLNIFADFGKDIKRGALCKSNAMYI